MSQDIFVVIEHLRGKVADISYVMLAAARVIAQATGGQVVAALLGHNAQELAGNLAADRVLYVEHPALADFTSAAYQTVLESLLREHAPRAALLGDTSIGGDVAAWLAARLSWPLVSSCRSVSAEGAVIRFVSQTCGGKIMAEGDLPGPCALVMIVPGGYKPEQGQSAQTPQVTSAAAPPLEGLRVAVDNYVEPDTSDVDISREPILVSVGRGIQTLDSIGLVEELARALGCPVCASRPIVDQGWLPTTRLVGKSGKVVKPRLYLALGISGAPEHVEGMGESEMIIAVNTDPAAPIFNVAKYGATVDLFDLAPALTEKIQEARRQRGTHHGAASS
ncbi:MAG: electron transfer flavoprotein subunit alpha/FixB family protein [Chloroflexi bacterium]|nr:electron transfer flavoprotein subunit alpha/FixB family protein [Chloroflexota bacterium]MCL5274290.1 electron transfer flavoprotein subunit alpha/FixB family protein [Chloroflexota bacterium]